MAYETILPELGSAVKGNREREFDISESLGLIRPVERVAIEADGLFGVRLPVVAGYLPEVRVGRDQVVSYAVLVDELRRQHPYMIFAIWIDDAHLPHVPEFADRGIG